MRSQNFNYNFILQWRPNFVSAIAAEDLCHLNGMAMVNRMPKYVTVLGKTDIFRGWRENKASGGCILEVPTSKVITEGLSMPHSPRIYSDRQTASLYRSLLVRLNRAHKFYF